MKQCVGYSGICMTVKTSGSETLNIPFSCLEGRFTMKIGVQQRVQAPVLSVLKLNKETTDSCLGDSCYHTKGFFIRMPGPLPQSVSGVLHTQLSVVYFSEHGSDLSPLPLVLESEIYSGQ